MRKKLSVNWVKLKEMSEKTRRAASEFEESRVKYQEIIKSLDECWAGIDFQNFQNNCNEYLDDLKNDSIYLDNLGIYFEKCAGVYSGVVESHTEKINKINADIEDENKKMDEMVGV